ncbi:hypothetical protein GUITHDRAFT_116046 [Guillardia theta CCMP2712]|uniref:Uncharacterized protein n=1 Tax=Guillardia theta (strain CCMP2712) TaxID=905079 RepID=L1IPJ1_GUITC|nr:hypothetical protein GUITHDRAFT_116046 [Guillardia theta CCMP2712]EKX37740.1 hypothetical protein GUITHDRAFT_116046 [Guillardia theta CCMP2712]|eukprot:XP_005824720.1 hypothetical protein GUITHDRAFT_116046 [Guillardia theta CCMP2712]
MGLMRDGCETMIFVRLERANLSEPSHGDEKEERIGTLLLDNSHGSRLLEDVMNLLGMPSSLNIVRDEAGEDPGYPRPTRIRGHLVVGLLSVVDL